MSVFVDTSALYAAIVRTEEHHSMVLDTYRELLQSGRPIHTTNYVVVETAALLQHRVGLEAVHDFDGRILPVLQIHWVTEDLHRKAMRRLLRENQRQVSLVDCVGFEFMAAEGLRDAFALDRHFATAGFRLLPGSPH